MTPRSSQVATMHTVAEWATHRADEIQGLLLLSAGALAISGLSKPAGQLGHLAITSREAFGLGAFFPAAILATWGLRRIHHRQAYRGRGEVLAWALLLPLLCGALERISDGTGGRLGFWMWAYLRVLAGPVGGLIVMLTAGIITTCACLHVAPSQLLRRGRTLAWFTVGRPGLAAGRATLWLVASLQHVIYLGLRDLWVIINLLSRRLQAELQEEWGGAPPAARTEATPTPGEAPASGAADLDLADTPPPVAPPAPRIERPARVQVAIREPLRLDQTRKEEVLASPRMARAAAVRRSLPPPEGDIVMEFYREPTPVPAGDGPLPSYPFPAPRAGGSPEEPPPFEDPAPTPAPEPTAPPPAIVGRPATPAEAEAAGALGFEVDRPHENLPSSSEILEEARAESRTEPEPKLPRPYLRPPLELFNSPPEDLESESDEELQRKAELITTTLGHFGIDSTITRVTCGPTITQFELKPGAGVKLSKLTSLSDDLAMGLAVGGVRIEAPIPGRGAVGIEVPNKTSVPVFFQEMAAQKEFRRSKASLTYVLGKSIAGKAITADLHKAPHMLVAGATGAGKSVCMNSIISSLLIRNSPDQLKMILIDPKMVEMMVYDGVAHLVTPVITDPKAAAAALQWAVLEMERRYKLLSAAGYRNISGFNEAVESGKVTSEDCGGPPNDSRFGPLPYMVIVIDELADLMMVAAKDIEDSICRLAQMARAVGMHLIVATQRPSTNVITGIIKANLPTRIAFRVASKIDSKVILDHMGAEALLGKGDMLYHPVGQPKPVRLQGALIEEDEIKRLVTHIKEQCEAEYEDIVAAVQEENAAAIELDDVNDEYLVPCIKFAVEKGEVSTSLLQRHFKIGYNRAACIVDVMEAKGIISSAASGRRRQVVMGPHEVAEVIQRI